MYLYSKSKQASPATIDLVVMLIEKYKAANYDTKPDVEVPQYFIQLYYKVLLAKGNY